MMGRFWSIRHPGTAMVRKSAEVGFAALNPTYGFGLWLSYWYKRNAFSEIKKTAGRREYEASRGP